jgi:hypothetical protein
VLVCDGYLAQAFDLALVPISKDNSILGIPVLDVGGEHLLLPRHVVCASAIDNPAQLLLGHTRLVTTLFGTQMQVLSPLHLDPNFLATTFAFFT